MDLIAAILMFWTQAEPLPRPLPGDTVPINDPAVFWPKDIFTLPIQNELVDEREYSYFRVFDWPSLSNQLQERFENYDQMPRTGEADRFPDRSAINAFLAVNRQFHADLQRRLAIDLVNEDTINRAISECDQLYQIYDTLRDARCEYYYVTTRRQALQLLKILIGEESFYSGRLPPPYPVWHMIRN